MKTQADPAYGAYVATKDDVAANVGNGFIFTGGTCTVIGADGVSCAFPAAFANVKIDLSITKVMSTGTTATTIIVFKAQP